MASFQVDVQDGGSHSFWTYYDDPTAIALVRQAETEFDSAKRAVLYREDPGPRCSGCPVISPSTTHRTSTPGSRTCTGFAVNPGGTCRLEDVWLS